MLISEMSIRGQDTWGSGKWGAPRGSRTHKGIDLCAEPGELLTSSFTGIVTKIGWTYNDPKKSICRYVEVAIGDYQYRYHYIKPMVNIGDKVSRGTVLGELIDLGQFYPDITNHIHFGVRKGGIRIDPTPVWLVLKWM